MNASISESFKARIIEQARFRKKLLGTNKGARECGVARATFIALIAGETCLDSTYAQVANRLGITEGA